jgi:MarR family transcriptional regulator, negative regulator of the multidrug operon emrRAB
VQSESTAQAGRLEQHAADIEAGVRRTAARFRNLPIVETVALRLLVLLGREISSLLEKALRSHGLNETDFRSLLILFSQPGGVAHPSDLCAAVAQSPANMTRVADSLCERGLITRVASEQDRRRTILRITPAGEALALAVLPQTAAHIAALFEPMPQSARQLLLEQLRTLAVLLDQSAPTDLAGQVNAPR